MGGNHGHWVNVVLLSSSDLLPPVVIAIAYSGVVSYILAKGIDVTIGLRVSEDDERQGLDLALHEEQGYILAE